MIQVVSLKVGERSARVLKGRVTVRRVFFILFLSVFTSMLGLGIVGPILPLYAEQSLGASGIWIGLIFAGFGISRTVITPLIGRMSDEKGRRNFLIVGLLGYALTGLGYVIAGNVVLLTIIRFANGFTSAMVLPVAQAYIGDITPKGKEGTYMNTFMISLMVGFAAGPFIGGWLTDAYSFSAAFYAMAAFSALALALVVFFLPESDELPFSRFTRRAKGEEEKNKNPGALQPSMREAIRDDYVKAIVIYRTAAGLSRNALVSFLPIFLAGKFLASATQIGVILAIFLMVGAIVQTPMGVLADRVDKVKMLLSGMGFSAVWLFITPFIPNLTVMGVIAFVSSLFSVMAQAPALAVGTEIGRRYGMATVMSLYDVAIGVGMVGGPLISGLIVDNFGINMMFYFWGVASAVSVMCCYVYFKRGREKYAAYQGSS
ncbi:MAG: MFS transporter [Candidatus Freyarchaeota archaeon]